MKARTTSLSHSASSRRRGGRRSGFSPAVRHQILRIEAIAIFIAALTGILCGLVSIWLEALIPTSFVESHSGFVHCVCVVLINIAVSIFEVNGMYLTAVVCAFRLTVCTNPKLYPQDAEREFLARSIARAALQVGHRKDKIFGIDPMKGSPRLVLFLTYLMFKGKRYMLKFLLKLLIKRVLWRAAAKSALSLIVLPINGVMNAWNLRNVMLNCRVCIIGPPCAIDVLEVFFLEDGSFSPQQRVDYICAMGCNLVCKRSVPPNLEIMLDHMRHRWITPKLWPVSEGCICASNSQESCPVHLLDDIDRFIVALELYASHGDAKLSGGLAARQHIRNVFFLLIVALIINGKLDWVERRLYFRVCQATKVQARWTDILRLKDDFVKGKGIHVDTVYALIVEIDHSEANSRVPLREALTYFWNRISGLLA
uniref:Uncharacterized protein n=1 Tax=Globisporangium ultimum (strain ATCC 200006 / CBS 805.95 / DAOM BR144) TaxID=431595 RepID=K3WC35_GLOUD